MRLEELRKQKGWTQKQVAQEVGLQLEVYRRYEKEIYEPPVSVVIRLMELYGCSADDLLGLKRSIKGRE